MEKNRHQSFSFIVSFSLSSLFPGCSRSSPSPLSANLRFVRFHEKLKKTTTTLSQPASVVSEKPRGLFVIWRRKRGKTPGLKIEKSFSLAPLLCSPLKHRRGLKRFPASDSLLSVNLLQAGHFLLKPAEAKFLHFQTPYRRVRVEHYPINTAAIFLTTHYNWSQFTL